MTPWKPCCLRPRGLAEVPVASSPGFLFDSGGKRRRYGRGPRGRGIPNTRSAEPSCNVIFLRTESPELEILRNACDFIKQARRIECIRCGFFDPPVFVGNPARRNAFRCDQDETQPFLSRLPVETCQRLPGTPELSHTLTTSYGQAPIGEIAHKGWRSQTPLNHSRDFEPLLSGNNPRYCDETTKTMRRQGQ
jgi:hypothetical protein